MDRPSETEQSQQWRNFYKDPLLNSYLSEQIRLLSPKNVKLYSGIFLGLEIDFPSKTADYSYSSDHSRIQFIILLGKGFPKNAPRLYLKSIIAHPSFSDTRDFFREVMGEAEWNPKTQLVQISENIPKFLMQLKKNEDTYYYSRIGNYQMNTVFPTQLLKQLCTDRWFYGFEVEEERLIMYSFTISDTHFCMYICMEQPVNKEGKLVIPHEKHISISSLVFWAEIGSLIEIKLDRSNPTDVELVFRAKKPTKMNIQDKICTKVLRIRKGPQFCQHLIKSIKNFEVLEMKLDIHKEDLDETEQQILEMVKNSEEELNHKLNSSTIRAMNDSYQRAIEFYSGKNVPHYEIFLDKISRLYQRADVRVIMSSEN